MADDFLTTVNQARTGDRAAFDSLFARHLTPLAAFVRMRAGGAILARESVDDLVQSVCREVLEGMDDFQYRGEEAFRSWLFLQATRKIVDRGRFHRAAKRDVRQEVHDGAGTDAAELLQCYATLCTPTRAVSAREELARLEAAIARLPENQREAVAMSRVLDLPYEDVARHMQTTESAVRGLVARGLATLARMLAAGDGDAGGR